MSKTIQIRNVPDGLYRTLKARAALVGMSFVRLSAFRDPRDRGATNFVSCARVCINASRFASRLILPAWCGKNLTHGNRPTGNAAGDFLPVSPSNGHGDVPGRRRRHPNPLRATITVSERSVSNDPSPPASTLLFRGHLLRVVPRAPGRRPAMAIAHTNQKALQRPPRHCL